MGLKSGSRDSGLDEIEDNDEQPADHELAEIDTTDPDINSPAQRATHNDRATDTLSEAESTGQRPSMDSIPYKLRREKVNEGREQVPYFLRQKIIDAEDEFQDTLEEILGENVYKSDYREAAMIVAQRNPELVADILREWGYDL